MNFKAKMKLGKKSLPKKCGIFFLLNALFYVNFLQAKPEIFRTTA